MWSLSPGTPKLRFLPPCPYPATVCNPATLQPCVALPPCVTMPPCSALRPRLRPLSGPDVLRACALCCVLRCLVFRFLQYLTMALSAFSESPRVTEALLNNLSNWSVADNCSYNAQLMKCGVFAVDALRKFYLDLPLVTQALNFVGNLSLSDQNVTALADGGCIKVGGPLSICYNTGLPHLLWFGLDTYIYDI